MRTPTPRERRLIAVGILVLVIAVAWLAIARPLIDGFVDRAAERRRLTHLQQVDARLIASLPALQAAADAQRAASPRFALAAASESAASDALKARLRSLAAAEGFTLSAVEDLEADAPAGEVRLRADMTLTLTQLYETVRRLQSEDAYVVVDYVSVTADRSLAAGRLAPLDVRLELAADWRPGPGRP